MSETTELIAQQILNGNINKRTWGDILYNVKVYGAKGDWNTVTSTGTDDTAAIQATIDYAISVGGKAIFFPHGTYKVTVLTNLSSVVLFGDNASFSGISDTISQLGNPSSNLVYNVKDFGSKGDGVTDDTASLTKALQTAYIAGGGVVHAPQGIYLLKSQITIPKGVILMGIGSKAAPQWFDPTGWDKTYCGTVFAVDWGAGGSSITNAAFLMSSYSKIIGCNFWYPSQSGSTLAPAQYPPTVAHVNGDPEESSSSVLETEINNCVFVNPWICGDFSRTHELLNIKDVLFYAWKKGFIIDQSADIDRFEDIHGNPNVMYRGNWPANNAYEYSLANSGVGFDLGRADQMYMTRCFVFGFDTGCWIHKISAIAPNGVYILESGFEGSNTCISVTDNVRRVNLTTVILGTVARSTANRSLSIDLTNDSVIDECTLVNVTSFTSAHESFYFSYVKHLSMQGCKLYGAVQFDGGVAQYALKLSNCKGFTIKDTHIDIYGSNPNALVADFEICNGFVVEDLFLSGQSNVAAEVLADACTNGRINRVFRAASSGAAPSIVGSSNVTVTDTIVY